ncbi:MAG: Hpt domain-containing protein [Treponema sp.]|nr:Hpt domain-containing protein [Treponema sp.]
MITIESLREFGADVDTGLTRCLGKEDFYIKMVNLGLKDPRFVAIKAELDSKNLTAAFEMAHALKGVVGNLALTPLYEPLEKITNLLRANTDTDYSEIYEEIKNKYEKLLSI